MDEKGPKSMGLRNKNAPKALESGTPEAGNQLSITQNDTLLSRLIASNL